MESDTVSGLLIPRALDHGEGSSSLISETLEGSGSLSILAPAVELSIAHSFEQIVKNVSKITKRLLESVRVRHSFSSVCWGVVSIPHFSFSHSTLHFVRVFEIHPFCEEELSRSLILEFFWTLFRIFFVCLWNDSNRKKVILGWNSVSTWLKLFDILQIECTLSPLLLNCEIVWWMKRFCGVLGTCSCTDSIVCFDAVNFFVYEFSFATFFSSLCFLPPFLMHQTIFVYEKSHRHLCLAILQCARRLKEEIIPNLKAECRNAFRSLELSLDDSTFSFSNVLQVSFPFQCFVLRF